MIVPGADIGHAANSSAGACRAACGAQPLCGLYVLFTNASCVLRARPSFDSQHADGSDGMRAEVAVACLHARRISYRVASPDVVRGDYVVRMGADGLKQGKAHPAPPRPATPPPGTPPVSLSLASARSSSALCVCVWITCCVSEEQVSAARGCVTITRMHA